MRLAVSFTGGKDSVLVATVYQLLSRIQPEPSSSRLSAQPAGALPAQAPSGGDEGGVPGQRLHGAAPAHHQQQLAAATTAASHLSRLPPEMLQRFVRSLKQQEGAAQAPCVSQPDEADSDGGGGGGGPLAGAPEVLAEGRLNGLCQPPVNVVLLVTFAPAGDCDCGFPTAGFGCWQGDYMRCGLACCGLIGRLGKSTF
jgi:hypothetical protein